MDRKLRYGMVGGGPDAFIGGVHRMAAALDGEMELVAGAFSSSPEKSKIQGAALHLSSERVYDSYQEMAERELARAAGDRIDFVSIVTPNHLHYEVARCFIEAGIHVICDKPLTNTVEDAESLCRLVAEKDVVFALTHNYTGYPMVKQARAMVADGKLGVIRKIVVEYPQGWLSTLLEAEGHKQAEWRTDPDRAGVSSALGDIGTHAENLAEYITGLQMTELFADLDAMVEGRQLDDDGSVLIHYENGARGILYASQISVGEENNLQIRIYGTDAALRWSQEHPNWLHISYPSGPEEIFKRGNEYLAPIARHNTRIPAGHPEAFLEAFANIYRNAGRTIAAKITGQLPSVFDLDFPSVQDGARGVHFVVKAVESSRRKEWIDVRYEPPRS
ncbi:MAG: Gfo/Idh/MocA family oxidoreductase [Bacteroidetes bacterium]|nr:MAG: Gfo/Idh/MocA family oxidoreductase [Bacteroidota bacterium]